jgi:hypothetical protein
MLISQLLEFEEISQVAAIEGGVQTLEATVVHTLLTNTAASGALKTALQRTAKNIAAVKR